MIMRPHPGTERSIGSSSWMKRLSGIWNVENIKVVRRVIVSVIGATVLLIGVALLVLPGPAFIVIPIGLHPATPGERHRIPPGPRASDGARLRHRR